MRKLNIVLLLIAFAFIADAQTSKPKAPEFALGTFTDDYGISYVINDTIWTQNPKTKYHIIKWNPEKQYLVAKNDVGNKTDANKYTRIDYMTFTGMAPYLWGFCLTAYDAETDVIAEQTAAADRQNPKKGCNGYPFSRMKRVEIKPTTN
ncbi:hypothetical protein EZ428_14130 [Pedobacter frigiditerrae]|uniref:Uncharacterized protein n=1 Tax=Pedobacter frigiditerrae TaxID=2530452 RepID=A0A4R0MTL4_9SPHI|nr:hypothetical protein [Pedobacter frigiditerrae]TCC90408.1 hypothetical protein EZ428_14130 [Pedobacter frigiditerrae]